MKEAKHPIQPLVLDDHGVIRYKGNAIVEYLLDHGGIDLNKIANISFPKEDREQFAQLINYSHSGSVDQSDEVWAAAQIIYEDGVSELEARNKYLRELLDEVKKKMRDGVSALYEIHPNSLQRGNI